MYCTVHLYSSFPTVHLYRCKHSLNSVLALLDSKKRHVLGNQDTRELYVCGMGCRKLLSQSTLKHLVSISVAGIQPNTIKALECGRQSGPSARHPAGITKDLAHKSGWSGCRGAHFSKASADICN